MMGGESVTTISWPAEFQADARPALCGPGRHGAVHRTRVQPAGQPANDPTSKIEGALATTLATKGSAEFLVYFNDQADTSFAKGITDWARRSQAVMERCSGRPSRARPVSVPSLTAHTPSTAPNWIANAIYVKNDSSDLVSSIAADSKVS